MLNKSRYKGKPLKHYQLGTFRPRKLGKYVPQTELACTKCNKGTLKPTQWNRLVCSKCDHSVLA